MCVFFCVCLVVDGWGVCICVKIEWGWVGVCVKGFVVVGVCMGV